MTNIINATDYDATGKPLQDYCLRFRATKLWFLTDAQRQELAEGREVIVITPRGKRTDIGGQR